MPMLRINKSGRSSAACCGWGGRWTDVRLLGTHSIAYPPCQFRMSGSLFIWKVMTEPPTGARQDYAYNLCCDRAKA